MEINFRWTRTLSPAKTRRDEARYLNRIIDRALLQPTMQHREEVLSSAKHRDTPRLAAVRPLAARFKGLHILAIPRLHIQVANVLAKQAVKNGVATSPEENQAHQSGQ